MHETAYFALGCFWGAEKLFWETEGVMATAVGYMGGDVPNPSYQQVCTGRTGHTETVRVDFDPDEVSYHDLLIIFFENHDPTQGDRQGNDVGTQYRSAIFAAPQQAEAAKKVSASYQESLTAAGYGKITTEITEVSEFYLAEEYHQKYLLKNPLGYCPTHATGVTCGR